MDKHKIRTLYASPVSGQRKTSNTKRTLISAIVPSGLLGPLTSRREGSEWSLYSMGLRRHSTDRQGYCSTVSMGQYCSPCPGPFPHPRRLVPTDGDPNTKITIGAEFSSTSSSLSFRKGRRILRLRRSVVVFLSSPRGPPHPSVPHPTPYVFKVGTNV